MYQYLIIFELTVKLTSRKNIIIVCGPTLNYGPNGLFLANGQKIYFAIFEIHVDLKYVEICLKKI
jgi:hypothetical protein